MSGSEPRPAFIIGDVHGQLAGTREVLIAAGLATRDNQWCGADAELWFIGDFVDRGDRGVQAIEYVMDLQRQAADAGGKVNALLGNHDLLLLAARHFKGSFAVNHQRNGGAMADIDLITPRQVEWLRRRPAMARTRDHLLMHADTIAYLRYGTTVEAINTNISKIMLNPEKAAWDSPLGDLSDRHSFDGTKSEGSVRAIQFLTRLGARRMVHGHTPISFITDQDPTAITEPYFYADDRCVNVDGGLYLGGPGFVYQMEEVAPIVRLSAVA